jgi:hypothetical protein
VRTLPSRSHSVPQVAETRRARVLLAAVGVLAAMRFLLVPWIAAQDERREQLQALTRRLDRSESVVHNRGAIASTRQVLEKQVDALRSRFPMPPGIDQFRLSEQRRIGDIVRQCGVTMQVFDWIVEGDQDAAKLRYGRARMTIEGTLADLIRAHGALEGSSPNAAIRELQLNLSSPADAPGGTRGTATLVVDLFFRGTGS